MNQELLHQLFEYRDGELYWKVDRCRLAKAGDIAGSKRPDGYWRTFLNGKRYYNHRLIFMMHYGYLPKYIDHIDGDSVNNRIENLREATNQQNAYNQKIRKNSTSGVKGVNWDKDTNKWRVRIQINGKRTHIGSFEDLMLAELVAVEARDKYHKEFARHE